MDRESLVVGPTPNVCIPIQLTLVFACVVAQSPLLPVVLVLAGLGSALILALALIALARRRS